MFIIPFHFKHQKSPKKPKQKEQRKIEDITYKKMKGHLSCKILMITMMMMLLILVSLSMNVEGMRVLKDESNPSSFISLVINRAYSGPSHKGRGH